MSQTSVPNNLQSYSSDTQNRHRFTASSHQLLKTQGKHNGDSVDHNDGSYGDKN